MAEKCPRCQSVLIEKDIDGVKVDQCDSCHGIFLDENELQSFKQKPDAVKKIDSAVSSSKTVDTESAVNCIRCKSPMDRANFSYTSGIFIDFCPLCNSMWLDDGELEKIVSFLRFNEVISETESKKYDDVLTNIRAETKKKHEADFRSISSGGAMGSIVNFAYRMIHKIQG